MTQIKKQLKKTNSFRRKFTRNLTGALSVFSRKKNTELIAPESIKRVLICRPNHRLGNQLLITPLVQEVNYTFPEAKIDLFLKGGLGNVIFENYLYVDKLIMLPKKHFKELHRYIYSWFRLKSRKYDLVINAVSGSSSGRLSSQIARSKYSFVKEETPEVTFLPADYNHFAKKVVYQLREFLKNLGIENPETEIPTLDIKLKEEEKINGKNLLNQITQNDKPTIGIYTFATADKCYAPEFWLPFYENLKKKYEKDYNIIEVLPVENVSQVNFTAPHFYSKDIRELASLMNAMKVFISADCGMMHLASASQVPVIGLFKFDNIDRYQPYGNNSVGIRTQDLNTDEVFSEINNILKQT